MRRKLLILEGSDGTGKSTQAGRLIEKLKDRGIDLLHIREPGSTPVGERIRSLLIAQCEKDEDEITPETEMLLYMACRAQLFKTVIRQALEKGQWVLLERSYYSTYAYQGWGLGIDQELILRLGEWVCDGIEPDRVILIDMPVQKSLARLKGGKDRIEGRDLDFHERVRKGYQELARRYSDLFRVVDGSGSVKEVEKRIDAEISDIR